MKNDEKKRIDEHSTAEVTMHVADSLGGLIYQRLQHLRSQVGDQKDWDIPEIVYEIRYLEILLKLEQDQDSDGDMFDIESGIMYDMWAHIVCVVNVTKMMDNNFCPKHFAKGVHERLIIMYHG